ncbi:DUF4263 domain-containing protein [Candidatus Gracilibacteria bacterium]|nr:DUF4263 domain-containing protein [Candidatus Gracilibacteria bacterium]
MPRIIKTPIQKLETKIRNLIDEDSLISMLNNEVKAQNFILFNYDNDIISYSRYRYYPTKVENIIEENFEVKFLLSHDNLSLLSSNICNPPKGAKIIIDLFRKASNPNINSLFIGYTENKIENNNLYVTKDFYDIILQINKEESKSKVLRFNNRVKPFLESSFNIDMDEQDNDTNYSLLLQEIIASGQISQDDIISLSNQLKQGNEINVVIEKQIIKQSEWLINKLQEILDAGKLNKLKAKELGHTHFGFSKNNIKGPEHLMEKILTKYGKYTLFGVPVLLNTDKYVINSGGLSRSQFDIILINHLSDIEVVELKRPDVNILEFDIGRCKFYASKELSMAISQAERYISAVYKDNDDDYLINGQKIKDFLNDQIGGTMTVEICRPKALIIMGTYSTIAPSYDLLDTRTKSKISDTDYNKNYLQAYKELKEAYKNIHILSYSELVENARTRILNDENI